MTGNLTREEIEQMLNDQVVGRIGCAAEGKVYVMPVNFVYHDGYIYAHAKEERKLHILRTSPSVCFEVDQMDGEENWKSVILWGKYEELRYPVRGAEGLKRLQERLQQEDSSAPSLHPRLAARQQVTNDRKPIAFRIKVTEASGQYEKPSHGMEN